MKPNKSSLKKIVIVMLLAEVLFYSCDNNNNSGKSSTTETDTTTTTINNDTSSTIADTSSTSATRKGRRTGRVAVAPVAINKTQKMATDKTGFYNYAEVTPAYNGGQGAIETYITNNIQYPEEAIDNNIEGTVNIQFGIDENGNVSNVKAVGEKLGYGLEEEAVKVISNMPKWTPGSVKGKNVKTWMTLPITYRFED